MGGTGVTQNENGSGTGIFNETISGLTENTQYSFAAYATNAAGTSYSAVETFTTVRSAPPSACTAGGILVLEDFETDGQGTRYSANDFNLADQDYFTRWNFITTPNGASNVIGNYALGRRRY